MHFGEDFVRFLLHLIQLRLWGRKRTDKAHVACSRAADTSLSHRIGDSTNRKLKMHHARRRFTHLNDIPTYTRLRSGMHTHTQRTRAPSNHFLRQYKRCTVRTHMLSAFTHTHTSTRRHGPAPAPSPFCGRHHPSRWWSDPSQTETPRDGRWNLRGKHTHTHARTRACTPICRNIVTPTRTGTHLCFLGTSGRCRHPRRQRDNYLAADWRSRAQWSRRAE